MFEPVDSVQEQLKRSREEQILEAAGRVFAERGYHIAKMRDVADAAGVSNGTVYNYFKSKEELLQALLHRLNETEQRASQFSPEGVEVSFRDLLSGITAHRMGFVGQHAEIFRAVLPELLSHKELQVDYRKEVLDPSFAMAEAWLEAAFEDKEAQLFREDLDPALVTRALAAQTLGLLVLRLIGDEVTIDKWEALPGLVSSIICDGLLQAEQVSNNQEQQS